jgi:membrane protease YdiL (CAAX protease family)
VLYEAFLADWGPAVAILGTAVCFGLGHMRGYPPGPLGAVLAGGYGLALGLLRWRSGGLALSIGCHICADATIFAILASAGAFRSPT